MPAPLFPWLRRSRIPASVCLACRPRWMFRVRFPSSNPRLLALARASFARIEAHRNSAVEGGGHCRRLCCPPYSPCFTYFSMRRRMNRTLLALAISAMFVTNIAMAQEVEPSTRRLPTDRLTSKFVTSGGLSSERKARRAPTTTAATILLPPRPLPTRRQMRAQRRRRLPVAQVQREVQQPAGQQPVVRHRVVRKRIPEAPTRRVVTRTWVRPSRAIRPVVRRPEPLTPSRSAIRSVR